MAWPPGWPAHGYFANVLLTLFVFRQLPSDYISAGLAVEGVGLLVSGFLLRDRLFRVSGLLVLGLLSGKLLFFDIAKYNTLERILYFIAAGVTFLLSSYGYARFARVFEDEDASDESAEGIPSDLPCPGSPTV